MDGGLPDMESSGSPEREVMTVSNKKTYSPAKTFDDDFARLIALCQEESWNVPSHDMKALGNEVEAQRLERADHDADEMRWKEKHENFGIEQEERYLAYSSILNGMRGIFRGDKAKLAKLAVFTRSIRKNPHKNKPAGEAAAKGAAVTE